MQHRDDLDTLLCDARARLARGPRLSERTRVACVLGASAIGLAHRALEEGRATVEDDALLDALEEGGVPVGPGVVEALALLVEVELDAERAAAADRAWPAEAEVVRT